MIHLILAGGMGNQMFEYAYALQVQEQNPNDKICINSAYLNCCSDGRRNSLVRFRLSENTKSPNRFVSCLLFALFIAVLPFKFGIRNLIAKFRKRFRDNEEILEKRLSKVFFYPSNPYKYLNPISCKCRNKYLFGLFQNVRVLEHIEKNLKEQFDIITPPSDENRNMLEAIRSVNAVCLHIRRGDYLLDKYQHLQVCNYDYYAEAIKRAKSELESPTFFLFSTGHDDIEWVKKNYQFDADITYVDLDNPDYEELRLMKACRHFIISNSTFSWWAAFLGEAEDKKVWAPEVRLKHADIDIYPATWEKIPC